MNILRVMIGLALLVASAPYRAAAADVVVADVVTTIKPIHSLVAGVMGDTGQPAVLLRGGESPHDFALKPSQRRQLAKAKVVFLIDPRFETFLAKPLKTLPDTVQVVPLTANQALTMLPKRQAGVWAGGRNEDFRPKEGIAKDVNWDFHIWLNPQHAIILTRDIAAALTTAFPENKAIYHANAAAQIAALKSLDVALEKQLKSLQKNSFLVFHDAFQYVEQRYQLTAVGALTLEPNQSVSIKRVRQLRGKIIEANVRCVFREPLYGDKLVNTLIDGTNVASHTLDPIGLNIPAGPALYTRLMQDLAAGLTACLSPENLPLAK